MTGIVKLDFRKLRRLDDKQRAFIEAWFSPKSGTMGNAYKSAISVGYTESYARTITGNAKNMKWVQDAKEQMIANLSPAHIVSGIQHEALNAKASRDRISAWAMMAKINGLFIDRSQSEVSVRFVNSVPRPIVDSEMV